MWIIHTLESKKYRSYNVTVEEHALDICLRTNRVHNPWDGVMENEHENCSSEHICYVRDLLANVENWGCINSISWQVEKGSAIHEQYDHYSTDSCHNLKSLWILNVTKREDKWERSENDDSNVVWIKGWPELSPFVGLIVNSEWYCLHEAFCTTWIL